VEGAARASVAVFPAILEGPATGGGSGADAVLANAEAELENFAIWSRKPFSLAGSAERDITGGVAASGKKPLH
jgi:hypothetical protein